MPSGAAAEQTDSTHALGLVPVEVLDTEAAAQLDWLRLLPPAGRGAALPPREHDQIIRIPLVDGRIAGDDEYIADSLDLAMTRWAGSERRATEVGAVASPILQVHVGETNRAGGAGNEVEAGADLASTVDR